MVEQDDAEGLKLALEKMFSDSKLRTRLSEEGKKTAKNFRWQTIMDKSEAFYRGIAK